MEKKRFIFNLKNLNKFIYTPHFKLEDRKTVIRLLKKKKKYYLAKIDLKDAFLTVPVHKKYKKFLRFSFNNQLYEFLSLPFGLSTSPYVFTKLLKPVMEYLRNLGYLSVIYLDDILLMGRSLEECIKNVEITKNLLTFLGFLLNYDKCVLIPSNSCEFLGFIIDSSNYSFGLPFTKKEIKKIY